MTKLENGEPLKPLIVHNPHMQKYPEIFITDDVHDTYLIYKLFKVVKENPEVKDK